MIQLERRHKTQSMTQQSNQLPSKNSNVLSTLVEKQWQLGGQEVILLMNEDSGPQMA
jgi:hypothetical protein